LGKSSFFPPAQSDKKEIEEKRKKTLDLQKEPIIEKK